MAKKFKARKSHLVEVEKWSDGIETGVWLGLYDLYDNVGKKHKELKLQADAIITGEEYKKFVKEISTLDYEEKL